MRIWSTYAKFSHATQFRLLVNLVLLRVSQDGKEQWSQVNHRQCAGKRLFQTKDDIFLTPAPLGKFPGDWET